MFISLESIQWLLPIGNVAAGSTGCMSSVLGGFVVTTNNWSI